MKTLPGFERFAAAILPLAIFTFSGCGDKSAAPPAKPPGEAKPAALKSAEPTTFDEVTARLDPGGSLYLYLSTAQWLAGLSGQLASLRDLVLAADPTPQEPAKRAQMEQVFNVATALLKRSGLEDMTAIGASSIALEPGFHRNKFFMNHPVGRGDGLLWSVGGKAPHRLELLDLLPAETALAASADLDLALLISAVRQEIERSGPPEAKQALEAGLAQIAAVIGMPLDDVLQSLGGSVGLVLTLDPAKPIELPIPDARQTIPTPRLGVLLQTKDERIFARIEKLAAENPMVVRVDEPGLKMRTIAVPVLPAVTLRGTIAQWGNYLAIVSDDQLLRDLIAAQKSGAGLKATPEFARLSKDLPEQGNAFQISTQRFADMWNRLQREMMKTQAAALPGQAALMEKLLAYQKTGASYSVSTHLDNGWWTVSKGTSGAGQVLAPLVIAPAAVAAGIALPVFSKVQERGKGTKSLSNAKQIGLACILYAGDHGGMFPPTLEDLIPDYLPQASVFISPFAPDEEMGYRYTAGLTDKSPPATILLEDKFASAKKLQVVVYVDASGKIIPVK